jgi:uncharacterized RDD family membrane protein YckC
VDAPTLFRRLICNLYESLLLIAVVLVAAFPIAALTQFLPPQIGVLLLRIYLIGVAGFYFVLFWRKGQTLAMKTWHIRLVAADGGTPNNGRLWLRFALANLNLLLLGIGWWAALLRRDRQFLQDHLAGTRLIRN